MAGKCVRSPLHMRICHPEQHHPCDCGGSNNANERDDCDDNDPTSTVIADDVDCDGTLTADDCDDNNPLSTILSDDADCDTILMADDCDDNNPNSTAIADDVDCDGTLTTDDCDDNNPNSTILANDDDCDGNNGTILMAMGVLGMAMVVAKDIIELMMSTG